MILNDLLIHKRKEIEELKLRFRRRILGFAFLAFMIVLGAPVARDLRATLHARAEARRFTEQLIEARTLASAMRSPVALELGADSQNWKRVFYAASESCGLESPGPVAPIPSEGVIWKLQAQQEGAGSVPGRKLCWHPSRGLLLDSVPVDQGKLLISLASVEESGAQKDLAFVLVTHGGAELQTISY